MYSFCGLHPLTKPSRERQKVCSHLFTIVTETVGKKCIIIIIINLRTVNEGQNWVQASSLL
jgi:hypothetical protein